MSPSALLFAIDGVVEGYLTAALWSSLDERDNDHEHLDATCTVADFHPDTLEAARHEVTSFLITHNEDLFGLALGQIGHDLWLTRNHHGTGFWDRGLGERGERLSEVAMALGEVNLWVDPDGKVRAE